MSAITGIFYRKGKKVDPQLIQKMNDKLSHRGVDGSHTWVEDNVGLGHQMLHTTPESLHEKLPFIEEDLVITADARIDNREELAKKLDIEDVETVSDSYFILKAYGRWGEDCPDKLLGDFAFAIWDRKKEVLFCARDHMGVKPFYYYVDEEMFVFGTEIKALFEVEGVPYKLNKEKLALYLMKNYCLNPEFTFYKNIKSLPSANSLTIKKNTKKNERYWKLNPNLKIKMASEEYYLKAFRNIFSEAVRCRLRTNFSLGADLSGGLDSSSVVCMVRKILNEDENTKDKPLKTFSMVFDDIPECDERYYSEKVSNIDGIYSSFVNTDKISPLENIDAIFLQQDQPFISPHMTKKIKICSEMKKQKINVILSGEGGDETVSHGENHIQELFVTFKWKKFIREIKRSHKLNNYQYRNLFKYYIIKSIPYTLRKWIRIFSRKNTESILNKKFLKELNIDEKENRFNNLDQLTSKEYHYYVLSNSSRETTFGIENRRVSNFNIEIRYPYYDKRLVEFCYSLPTEMKLKNGWSRYILRIAMGGILPHEIQWRPDKTDLSQSYITDLLKLEKNTLKKIILDNGNLIKNYVNLANLRDILKKNESKKEKEMYYVWMVVLLFLWLKYTNILSSIKKYNL